MTERLKSRSIEVMSLSWNQGQKVILASWCSDA